MFELSIVIPVYKIRDYIVRCITSITDQWDDRVQVIIVDDGSPDDSIAMILDLCNRYENIEIHHKVNGGLSSARNHGLEKATGRYVYFVDGDDFLVDGVLKDLVDELEGDRGACYAFKHLTIEALSGKPIIQNDRVEGVLIETNDYLRHYRNPITNVWKVILLRKLLVEKNLTFRQGVLCEDLEWMTKLFLQVNEIVWIDHYVYVYDNSREDSIMNSLSVKRIVDLDNNIDHTKNMVNEIHEDEKRILLKKLLFIEWCSNLSFYSLLSKNDKKKVIIQDPFRYDRDLRLFRLYGFSRNVMGLNYMARGLYGLKRMRKKCKRVHFLALLKKKIME